MKIFLAFVLYQQFNKMEKDISIDFFSEILPPEVTHAILSYLIPIDIVHASVVSKVFASLLDTRGIWKRIVHDKFGPLNEEIFKGNIINWKKTYHRGCELLKFKNKFLDCRFLQYSHFARSPKQEISNERYSMANNQPNSLIFYTDRAKKKPFARLHFSFADSVRKWEIKLLGFSQKYALVGLGTYTGTLQLWDLTVDCKHTDDHKWKSAANKEEICKKGCSFVREKSISTITSEYYWHSATRTIHFMTFKGICTIDLNTGEESLCEVAFQNYEIQSEIISDVRVATINGVSNMFCHVQNINGDFFVNLTTKRVHLFVDKSCALIWIAKNLKVAVINSEGNQMRVVSIAEEHPKVLAKYSFDKMKMKGVMSSPEGCALFLWSHNYIQNEHRHATPATIQLCLWEVGYTIGQIKVAPNIDVLLPQGSYWIWDDFGRQSLVMQQIGVIDFNHKLNF